MIDCISFLGQDIGPDCSQDKLKERKNVLRKYLDNNNSLQLEALFSLQEIYVKYNKPAGKVMFIAMIPYQIKITTFVVVWDLVHSIMLQSYDCFNVYNRNWPSPQNITQRTFTPFEIITRAPNIPFPNKKGVRSCASLERVIGSLRYGIKLEIVN